MGAWLFNEVGALAARPLVNPNDKLTLTIGTTGTSWLYRPTVGYGIGTSNATIPGSGGGAKLSTPSSSLEPSTDVSMFWYGTILGAGNLGNNPALVGITLPSSPFTGYGIYRKNGDSTALYFAQSLGGTANFHAVTGIVSTSVNPVSYGHSVKSGSQVGYKNGLQVGTASDSGTMTYTSGALYVASDPSNEDPAVLTSMVLIWNRFLSAQEHFQLASNPFQILVPLARPPRTAIAAAPPVPYPNWWTDIQMPQLLPQ